MATKRLYRCDSCGFQFHHFHMSKNEPLLEDCPNDECVSHAVAHDVERERAEGEARIARMVDSGIPPGNPGIRSRAMDMAQRAMEEMGHTDANDSGRAGDRAAKTPAPPATAEIEAMTRQAVEAKALTEQDASKFAAGARTFWQGAKGSSGGERPAKLQQHINASATGANIARNMGADPIKLLHDGEKKAGGMKLDVIARAKG